MKTQKYNIGEKVTVDMALPVTEGGGREERTGIIEKAFYNTKEKEWFYHITQIYYWVKEDEIFHALPS